MLTVMAMYVADCGNHRIQVYTADGVYLRQFEKEGEGEGDLNAPISIAIDCHGVVYVRERGNNRVSLFVTNGEFVVSRMGQFKCPSGLE